MRISLGQQKEGTLFWINRKSEDISRLTAAIASGKKLAVPSDSPSAWSQAMGYKQSLREYESILGNIDFATGWNQSTDTELNSLGDILSEARQAAISAIGTEGIDSRDQLGEKVDAILKRALKAANAQYGDQYIFSGTKTDVPPFSLDDDPSSANYGQVTYNGNLGIVQVRTNKGANGTEAVNLTGADVFSFTSGNSTHNVLEEIWQLREAVKSGDTAKVQAKLTTLDDAYKSVSKQGAFTGSRLNALETQRSTVELLQTQIEGWLSNTEDTDLAEAITRLQQEKTAFEAALMVTGKVDGLHLVNYL